MSSILLLIMAMAEIIAAAELPPQRKNQWRRGYEARPDELFGQAHRLEVIQLATFALAAMSK